MNRHVASRLKKELVIWLATVGAGGRPHAVPVWFLWDGKTFLVYAVPGQKVRDIQGDPNVAMHLNSDPEGGDVVRLEGAAKIVRSQPPADRVPGYMRKYRGQIRSLGMTPREFSEQYHVALRITPVRFHQ